MADSATATVLHKDQDIFFGILLSLTLYLYRVSRPAIDTAIPAMSNWIKPIYSTLDQEICRSCKYRIFPECQTHLPDGEPRAA